MIPLYTAVSSYNFGAKDRNNVRLQKLPKRQILTVREIVDTELTSARVFCSPLAHHVVFAWHIAQQTHGPCAASHKRCQLLPAAFDLHDPTVALPSHTGRLATKRQLTNFESITRYDTAAFQAVKGYKDQCAILVSTA